MQVLGGNTTEERSSHISAEHQSDEISSANSSFEYQEPLSGGTIDFKVDVHRKNSSESASSTSSTSSSSDAMNPYLKTSSKRAATPTNENMIMMNRPVTRPAPNTSNSGPTVGGGATNMITTDKDAKPVTTTTTNTTGAIRKRSYANKDAGATTTVVTPTRMGGDVEASASPHPRLKRGRAFKKTKSLDQSSSVSFRLAQTGDVPQQRNPLLIRTGSKEERSARRHTNRIQNRLQRQVSLDNSRDEMQQMFFDVLDEEGGTKLQRHRSTDSGGSTTQDDITNNSNISLGILHPNQFPHNLRSHNQLLPYSYLFLSNFDPSYTTKSELAIENIPGGKLFLMQPATSMHRDSNSTMSAIQLPIAGPTTGQTSTSRVRRIGKKSGTSSAYSQQHSGGAGAVVMAPSVRRIKSAALETTANPGANTSQTSSYLITATQPNSVEAIAGSSSNSRSHLLNRNLSRNPGQLKLFPKPSTSNSSVIEPPVYPIAELEVDDLVSSRAINHALLNINLSSDTESGEDDNPEEVDDILEEPHASEVNVKWVGVTAAANPDVNDNRNNNDEQQDNDGAEEGACGGYRDVEMIAEESLFKENAKVIDEDESEVSKEEEELDDVDAAKECSNTCHVVASTDSDTENNNKGSQSPLLDVNRPNRIVITEQRSHSAFVPAKATEIKGQAKPGIKGEDSGCPSSDWEQVSAGSKDMLLLASSTTSAKLTAYEDSSRVITHDTPDLERRANKRSKKKANEDHDEDDDLDDYVYHPIRNLFSQSSRNRPESTTRRKSNDEFQYRQRMPPSGSQIVVRGPSQLHQSQTRMMQPVLTFFKSSRDNQPSTSSAYREYSEPNVSFGSYAVVEAASGSGLSSRGLTTRSSGRFSRQRRQPSTEVVATSKDNFDPSLVSGSGAGLESSDCGSGTLGGSIDNSLTLRDLVEMGYDKLFTDPVTGNRTLHDRPLLITEPIGEQQQRLDPNDPSLSLFSNFFAEAMMQKPKKKYYRFPISCCGLSKDIEVAMDRLQLMALFDRDSGWFQVLLAIFLAGCVAILGALILQMGFYQDILAFIFCFVIAGCQYSLLKSVQPDAASPIHGFNKTVAYSRPIYFCVCSGLLLGAHQLSGVSRSDVTLFGINFICHEFFQVVCYILSLMLLFFPILFSLGLFPQINTFLIYLVEQLDMHIFGGNAVCSLMAAIIAILKSILACFILYGLAYGGLIEPLGTQHISFSIFCAVLIPITYHMSRCASDFTNIWFLIKSGLVLHADDEVDGGSAVQPGMPAATKPPANESSCSGSQENILDNKSDSKRNGDSALEISLNIPEEPGKSSISLQPMPHSHTGTHSQVSVVIGDPLRTTTSTTSALNNDNEDDDELNSNLNAGNSNRKSSSEWRVNGEDPLPKKLQKTVNARLRHDLMVCSAMAVVVLSLHCSTIFTVLQPEVNPALHTLAAILGFLLHYIVPQMRKHWPWLCVAKPILRQAEHGEFEPENASRVMWFESTYVYLCFLERNVLYPIVFLSALTADSSVIVAKFGYGLGTAIVVLCGLKGLRNAYSDTGSQYLILLFTVLLFRLDFAEASETFLVDYFLISIIYRKVSEFLLKLQFIVTYIAPWQITWGSAFHAFGQPFSVPHSAMLFVQAGISAALSTPLNPFLGSAIFLTSYVRPIKFWERDYNTRRIDHSNTRLSSQLERDLGADDNNLNSIFYEHLTRSLQHSLCGDLIMGRWGQVSQGDCFVLASDYLNCLVHVIELGNGLCTFQMRGLEFRGTYCQQREVEAISEGIEENGGREQNVSRGLINSNHNYNT